LHLNRGEQWLHPTSAPWAMRRQDGLSCLPRGSLSLGQGGLSNLYCRGSLRVNESALRITRLTYTAACSVEGEAAVTFERALQPDAQCQTLFLYQGTELLDRQAAGAD
jgi:hypothetical protein